MSDRRTRDALDAIATHANQAFAEADEEEVNPYEIFQDVFGGAKTEGEIQPLSTPPETYADTREKILSGKRWNPTYGLDAGVFPRVFEFMGGARMNIANAVFGHHNGNKDLASHRTVVSALHSGNEDAEYTHDWISENEYSHRGRFSRVTAEAYHVTEPSEGSINDWVTKVARLFAEGQHFNRYVDELDGVLFIDGPIYPLGLAHESIYGREKPKQVDEGWNECAHDILQVYAEALEKQLLSGNPVYGIVKTSRTTEVVDSIAMKAGWIFDEDEEFKFPYPLDHSFMSDLLYSEEHEDKLTHTSWMVRPYREWEGKGPIDVFGESELEELTPRDLARAFFYVRIPTGDVFRVEVPSVLVKGEEQATRDKIKQYALWELAKENDVPRAVKNADADAKLDRSLRDRLIKKASERKHEQDYNKDRRWPSLDYTDN